MLHAGLPQAPLWPAGGSVMGMCGWSGSSWSGLIFNCFHKIGSKCHDVAVVKTTLPIVTGFSLGASSSRFARVGGGITPRVLMSVLTCCKWKPVFRKMIPETSEQLLTISGDNVGDVAGMGADLSSPISVQSAGTMVLGAAIGD